MSASNGSAVPAAPAARRGILHAGSLRMIGGGLLLIIGAFTPWVSTPLGNLSAIAGPGLWLLCAGVIAVAGALLPHRRVAIAHALVPAAACGAIVLWQLGTIAYYSAETATWGKMLPGAGMVIVGGGVALLLTAARRMYNAS
ncbi:hypothetical protein LP52_06295 [Streptomonospora alba]|uniref:Integral membrane protein n=1 Tax=Streptomonospora alba TaxID=183763 RepID=A0A0C2JRR3_9ACTN|nr:hypothetical protein [Streptomonospora alba]KIH99507.1 hypothetical protein LP52_06295 [Streptomonospora alba]